MLKRLLTLVSTLLALTYGAIAAEAEGATQFKVSIKEAIFEKDEQKLEALIYLGDASPEDRLRMTSMLRMVLLTGKEVEEIIFKPLPSDFDPVLILHGKKSNRRQRPRDWSVLP